MWWLFLLHFKKFQQHCCVIIRDKYLMIGFINYASDKRTTYMYYITLMTGLIALSIIVLISFFFISTLFSPTFFVLDTNIHFCSFRKAEYIYLRICAYSLRIMTVFQNSYLEEHGIHLNCIGSVKCTNQKTKRFEDGSLTIHITLIIDIHSQRDHML